MPPGCSRRVVTARSPGCQSSAQTPTFIPSVVEWVSAMSAASAVSTAATAARASAMRCIVSRPVVGVGPAGPQLVRRRARPWPPPSRPAAVRPSRCSGRSRRRVPGGPPGPPAGGPSSGGVGATTARIIPTMSGLARPEILATTEWLAEHLGRPGVRILDARWRPDGTGADVHRAGHVPGAVYVDWRADLVDTDEAATRSAWPPPVAWRPRRTAPASATGRTIVVYDDTQGLYAARVWWTLRAYGVEHVRILDGGFPAWDGRGPAGRAGSGRHRRDAAHAVHARGPEPLHLTTSDVRGLLGSPGRHAARRPGTGRVPRLRGQHPPARPHPGRDQRAGRRDARGGQPAPARRRRRCATGCTPRTSAAAGGWSATTGRASRRPSSPSC